MDGQPSQIPVEDMDVDVPNTEQSHEFEATKSPVDRQSVVELSSNTDTESCEAYISRTVELLASVEPNTTLSNEETTVGEKTSISDSVAITPGVNELIPECQGADDVPKVVFLDKPDSIVEEPECSDKSQNNTEFTENVPATMPVSAPVEQLNSAIEEVQEAATAIAQEGDQGLMYYRSQTEDDSCFGMETDTGSIARSTLADALYCQKPPTNISCPPGSSNESSTSQQPEVTGPAPLTSSSRLMIKQCFEETNPTYLSPGHPTVVFNQDQISSILRIVADESARASFEMLNSVVQRASRLNLRGSPIASSKGRRQTDIDPETDTDVGSESVMTYNTREGDSSPGFTSDAESRRDLQSSVSLPNPPSGSRETQVELMSTQLSPDIPSPDRETLASLRQEAIREKGKDKHAVIGTTKPKGPRRPRRKIGRVMKEEYFDSMPWTRVFVFGPLDPKWNPNKIYCQICKCNVSIRAKGPKEILRHYSTERHLRKDQRWRYEYLTIEDPITKQPRYQVRGKDGKILSNYRLQLELPQFINADLVEIEEKLPFYDEAMSGSDYMVSSPHNRARLQISILGHYLPLSGDIKVLRTLWQHTGTVVNHQSLFADIDWSTTRLSVSTLHLLIGLPVHDII